MWNGYIGQVIAATTKTMKYVGFVLLMGAVALIVYGGRTFLNVTQGPKTFDAARLSTISNPDLELYDYAIVRGRKTANTGLTWVEQSTRNGTVESERTTADFMVMAVGDRILVVKCRPGQVAEQYVGGLVQLPDNLKHKLLEGEDPDARAALLPLMLDATAAYDEDLPLGYVLVGALILAGFYLLVQSKRRTENPERHPICKALAQYGDLYSIVAQIDSEVASGCAKLGSAVFTPHWVISCSLTKSLVMARDEIVWIYRKRTKHSVNFIPTGTSHALVLRDTRGKLFEILAAQASVEGCMNGLMQQTPWVIFGYDKKVEGLYNKERSGFLQTVDQRRASTGTV
jgi:hypothetical protein